MNRLAVGATTCSVEALSRITAWLADGGLVAYPTDTFYGLGADPRSPGAVDAIFDVKGRDEHQAIPLIAASRVAVQRLAGPNWSPRLDRFLAAFWPGPLSVVVDAADLPVEVHRGLGTVAVRVPDHPVARALAEAAGGLITSTSANRSGHPPAQIVEALDAVAGDPRVLVVDAGPTRGGAPSTIITIGDDGPVIVRAGMVSADRVLDAWRASG